MAGARDMGDKGLATGGKSGWDVVVQKNRVGFASWNTV